MVIKIIKKCPECRSKAVKLYQNKSFEGRRSWIPIAWHCTKCGYTYNVAADTLMYRMGNEPYEKSYNKKCPKCSLRLVRLYRHINPKHGKQKWVSKGWYCTRCKYIWMDKKTELKDN